MEERWLGPVDVYKRQWLCGPSSSARLDRAETRYVVVATMFEDYRTDSFPRLCSEYPGPQSRKASSYEAFGAFHQVKCS